MATPRSLTRNELAVYSALLVAAHLVLAWGQPQLGILSLLVLLIVPGWLWVRILLGKPTTPLAYGSALLYSLTAGYGNLTLLVLLLSYLPGGISPWLLLGTFDLLVALQLGLLAILPTREWPAATSEATALPTARSGQHYWWLGGLILLVIGGGLRFWNLGYAEFQGDEARAILRAAGVLQGYEDVLFLHKKGPLEILFPTANFVLSGTLTEATARFPFALAGLGAIFGIWLLGARWFNPLTGWIAASFLAVDGYFIGFARIVQYQNVVALTMIALLLLLSQPVQPQRITGTLGLAALFLSTGILAHYEAVVMLLPALGVVAWFWSPLGWRPLVRALLGGAALTGGLLALFFVAFIRHPNFQYTFLYLTEDRIGTGWLYNNLHDFFWRSTLYDSSYAILLLILLTTAALLRTYWQGYPAWLAGLLSIVAVGGLSATLVNPAWLRFGEQDWTPLFFLLSLGLAWSAPRQPAPVRILWLWFGVLFLFALFLVDKPRTHVYIFFLPWFLLAATVVDPLRQRLQHRLGPNVTIAAGLGIGLALLGIFGNYAFRYFVSHTPEILRSWEVSKPQGYWHFYEQPETSSLFGFPQRSGWKAAGVYYQTGELTGAYTTDGDEWVTYWYTRGAQRCHREHAYYILGNHLGARAAARQQALEADLQQRYGLWGQVLVNEEARLRIYQREPSSASPLQQPLPPLEAAFDQQLATPWLPLTPPIVEPALAADQRHRFGNSIWLEGYEVDRTEVRAGDTLQLTLYWRAVQPVDERYTVFNQILGADQQIVAQLDDQPGCGTAPTDDWETGTLLADSYRLTIAADALPGSYRLISGLYLPESGERLPLYNAQDQLLGDAIELATITVQP